MNKIPHGGLNEKLISVKKHINNDSSSQQCQIIGGYIYVLAMTINIYQSLSITYYLHMYDVYSTNTPDIFSVSINGGTPHLWIVF